MRIALIHIEVRLAVEICVLRQCCGLCTLVFTNPVVGTEKCAGDAVNRSVKFLALVGVEVLCRCHVVTAERNLYIVHLLHKCAVVCACTVGVVNLDGDSSDWRAAFLYTDFLILRKSCCIIILGKNGFITIIHRADFLPRVEQGDRLAFLELRLFILDGVCES